MSSSISSSESSTGQSGAAWAFLKVWGMGTFCLGLILWAVLMLVDPYGTGRFTPFTRPLTYETGPRIAHLTRLRDPDFNAAIIGNSTAQLLSPERLNARTGLRFVQLSIPGTGPREQIALVKAMMRQRPGSWKALVIGLDGASWCDTKRLTHTANPFPFWLYDPGTLIYLHGLFRFDALQAMTRRIALLIGRERPARKDGYWDYELIYATGLAREEHLSLPDLPADAGAPSAAAGLKAMLASLPQDMNVLLLHPPIYTPPEPPTQSYIARMASCKAELAEAAHTHARARIVDQWISDPMTQDRTHFIHYNHYRRTIAEAIEENLATFLLVQP
jgi:hypothetical protein